LPAQLAGNWHHCRGPSATRVSATAKPPTQWSEEKNIQWKVAIDGCGSAALSRPSHQSVDCHRGEDSLTGMV